MPGGIGLAFEEMEIDVADVEFRALHLHLAAGHRFAEEVVHLQFGLHGLARLVERPVGLKLGLEFRQHVAVDGDGLLLLGAGHDRPHAVTSPVEFVGQDEVGVRDAEVVGLDRPLEDLVALGVLDLEQDAGPGQRGHAGPSQRQGAKMDCLPRLIQRLVRGQQRPHGALDVHGLYDGVPGGAGLDAHLGLPPAIPRPADSSCTAASPRASVLASVEQISLPPCVSRRPTLALRHGNCRPAAVADRDPHDRVAAGEEFPLAEDAGFQQFAEEVQAPLAERFGGVQPVADVVVGRIAGVEFAGELRLERLADVRNGGLGQQLAPQFPQFDLGLARAAARRQHVQRDRFRGELGQGHFRPGGCGRGGRLDHQRLPGRTPQRQDEQHPRDCRRGHCQRKRCPPS